MHASVHAKANPDKPALIVAETGETWSYAELDRRSNRVAQLFRARRLSVGGVVALFLDNVPDFFALTWGAQRSGLFSVCISSKLTAPEAQYIVEDSGAKLVVASAALSHVAERLGPKIGDRGKLVLGGPVIGWESLEAALAEQPDSPIADERAGIDMLFFGRHRAAQGRARRLARRPAIQPRVTCWMQLAAGLYGFGADSVYLSPAPMYRAAPLRWWMTVHRLGGTVIMCSISTRSPRSR